MSADVSNLRDTIIPKSDQLNADQLLAGPMTIRITGVRRGTEDQPVVIHYEGDGGRPYKPCKSMRKVLIFAWGEDGTQWVGRMATLFNKADVKFGGVQVGGIRISHLSHIKADIQLSLTATKGKKEPFTIKKLDANDPLQAARAQLEVAAREGLNALKAAWAGLTGAQRTAIGGKEGCPANLKAIAEKADLARQQPGDEEDESSVVAGLNAAVEAMAHEEPEPAQPEPEPAVPAKPAGAAGGDDEIF